MDQLSICLVELHKKITISTDCLSRKILILAYFLSVTITMRNILKTQKSLDQKDGNTNVKICPILCSKGLEEVLEHA
jgi:hypothetical protein